MSDEVQSSAFPDLVPEMPPAAAGEPLSDATAHPVPRRPGWVFVARRDGPRGWHLIRTVGLEGSVVTVCGITGRSISEALREIIVCPACSEAQPDA